MRYSTTLLFGLAAGVLCVAGASAQPAAEPSAEQRLATARIDLVCEATPLDAVVKQLSQAIGVPIVVDERVFKRYTAEQLAVTLRAEKLSGAKALSVCQVLGLEMAVQNGAVRIQDRAGRPLELRTRVFYIGDLTLGLRDFPGPPLGTGVAYPPRFRSGESLPDYDGPAGVYGASYGWQHHDRDADAVPLGTPFYEHEPSFQRPPYQGRARHAPFEMESFAEIEALAQRMQLATGGRDNWAREGVRISVLRGGRLAVTHSPGVLADVDAWLADARRAPPSPHDEGIPIEPVDGDR